MHLEQGTRQLITKRNMLTHVSNYLNVQLAIWNCNIYFCIVKRNYKAMYMSHVCSMKKNYHMKRYIVVINIQKYVVLAVDQKCVHQDGFTVTNLYCIMCLFIILQLQLGNYFMVICNYVCGIVSNPCTQHFTTLL